MNLSYSVVVIVCARVNAVYLSRENHRKVQDRAKLLCPTHLVEIRMGVERLGWSLGTVTLISRTLCEVWKLYDNFWTMRSFHGFVAYVSYCITF